MIDYIPILEKPFYIRLFESIDEDDSKSFEAFDEWNDLYHSMFWKLLEDIKDGNKKDKWQTIPINPLKRIWIEYAIYGMLRHSKMEKILDKFVDMTLVNCMKIYIYSLVYGRVSGTDLNQEMENEFELCFTMTEDEELKIEEYKKKHPGWEPEKIDYTIKQADPTLFPVQYDTSKINDRYYNKKRNCNIYPMSETEFFDKFNDYTNSHVFGVSDVLGDAIIEYAVNLIMADDVGTKIMALDRIFNLVHIAGTVAHWFVEGGIKSLAELSGEENLVYK